MRFGDRNNNEIEPLREQPHPHGNRGHRDAIVRRLKSIATGNALTLEVTRRDGPTLIVRGPIVIEDCHVTFSSVDSVRTKPIKIATDQIVGINERWMRAAVEVDHD